MASLARTEFHVTSDTAISNPVTRTRAVDFAFDDAEKSNTVIRIMHAGPDVLGQILGPLLCRECIRDQALFFS